MSTSPRDLAFDSTSLIPTSYESTSAPSFTQSQQQRLSQSDFDWQSWLSTLSDEQRASLPVPQTTHNLQQQRLMDSARKSVPVPEQVSHPQFSSSLPLAQLHTETHGHANPQNTSFRQNTALHQAPSDLRSTMNQSLPPYQDMEHLLPFALPQQQSYRPPTHGHLPTSPTSGIESDEGSLEKGVAMISLEAAAEPHYVGESSGSLWTTVISGGMHSHPYQQQQQNEGLKRQGIAYRNKVEQGMEPSNIGSNDIDVLQAIQIPLSDDTSTLALETVFSHLHPRYPFMDWVRFEKQWEEKDQILRSVGQKFSMDRQESTSAFFILMVLAIAAQLNRDRPLAGLLAPQQYYELAMPYLNVIVTLHNLPNIQGVTLRLCIGMGLHRNAAGAAVRTLPKSDIEMRKRVFWSCYIIDRMISLLLGRPSGISDEDIDVDLPDSYVSIEKPKMESLQLSSMVSAIHHIKLKRIESRIQKAVYGIKRQPLQQAADYWDLLNDLDTWEKNIPLEASSPDHWQSPSCSRDWFLLKGVEARLHLLRPLCAEGQTAGAVFVTHLAAVAARGCQIQKRMHQQGLPMSNASAHSAFICGLALLYALFLQPKIMPLKDVFRAIKATSNTLFSYAQHAHQSVEVLYDVFEDLSADCIEHISKRETFEAGNPSGERRTSVVEWQKASSQATSNLDPTAAGEYVNMLEALGLTVAGDLSGQSSYTEPLWDLAAFSPGNLFPLTNDNTMGL
ncbi:uncharacterized protein I206_103787 [Kwoniella pini CBS 10737]|uniref:Xylanolytic transcriptional activator regulatory domain-containing protein n=1 Tax=Kwoniella pini CBS 10737 TaxID=1296096 RepID=A0AAJ8MQ72_9TREE